MTAAVTERPMPTGEGLTFEKVWAMFQETDKKFQETDRQFKETDKKFQENAKGYEELRQAIKETEQAIKETEQAIKETDRIVRRNGKLIAKTDKQIAENGRQIGGLHRSFGQLAEHLVAPGIEKRFNELGYHFGEIAPKGHKIKDKEGKILTEIDILLENGETVIAVEVKAKPAVQDIEHHIKRLEILCNHRRGIKDQRKILGAIAGAVYEDEVKEAVSEAGFFVIEQSGDTMRIDMPEGFVPREW